MMEGWWENAAEGPSFSQLKAKFDVMLLTQLDIAYMCFQFNINMTMPHNRHPPCPCPDLLEGGTCEEAVNTIAPDQTTTVPLFLPSCNLTQEEDSLGPDGSNNYIMFRCPGLCGMVGLDTCMSTEGT